MNGADCMPEGAGMSIERKLITGVKHFAWLPVRLELGGWVWLMSYYRYYNGYVCPDNTLMLWAGAFNDELPQPRNYLEKRDEYIVFNRYY